MTQQGQSLPKATCLVNLCLLSSLVDTPRMMQGFNDALVLGMPLQVSPGLSQISNKGSARTLMKSPLREPERNVIVWWLQ